MNASVSGTKKDINKANQMANAIMGAVIVFFLATLLMVVL